MGQKTVCAKLVLKSRMVISKLSASGDTTMTLKPLFLFKEDNF